MLCLVGPLAGRERSLPGIALALLAGQFGLHLIFPLGQGSTAPLRPTVPMVRDYETLPAMYERLGQHLGHRCRGIRKTLKCAFRVAERGLRPLGLLPQPRDLFQHLLLPGLQQTKHRRHQPPPRATRADVPSHLSHRQQEFMSTQPKPNDHVRKAEGVSVQSAQRTSW